MANFLLVNSKYNNVHYYISYINCFLMLSIFDVLKYNITCKLKQNIKQISVYEGTENSRILHKVELQDLYLSPNVISVVK